MVASGQLTQNQIADKILTATKPLFTKDAPVNVDGLSGWLALYSVTYEKQTSLVYKDGLVQKAQVSLELNKPSNKVALKSATNSANFIDNETVCITVTTCGYVNGELSNCISYQICYDTGGDGGGGDGDGGGGWGGGGGGGGSGGTEFPTGIDSPANVQEQTPTLGDYAVKLAISKNSYQVINVNVEIDRANHDLKKVQVTLNGIVWFTKLNQVGDGTLTGYDPNTDTYSFKVTYQKVLGDIWSDQVTMTGTISPRSGIGTLTIP